MSKRTKEFYVDKDGEPVLYRYPDMYKHGDFVHIYYSLIYQRIHIMTNIDSVHEDYVDIYIDALCHAIRYYSSLYDKNRSPEFLKAIDLLDEMQM